MITRRALAAVAAAISVLAGVCAPVAAVTNGVPDAGRHPFVGLAVFDVNGAPSHRCSVSSTSLDVVLTAGHCTDGATAAVGVVRGERADQHGVPVLRCHLLRRRAAHLPRLLHRMWQWPPGVRDLYDVGVIVLTEPVPTSVVSEYAILPAAGVVDTLGACTPVDLVGYGVQVNQRGGGQPVWTGQRVRLYAALSQLVGTGSFVHSDLFIRLSANPGRGKGGTCFGDSGGPDLLRGH